MSCSCFATTHVSMHKAPVVWSTGAFVSHFSKELTFLAKVSFQTKHSNFCYNWMNRPALLYILDFYHWSSSQIKPTQPVEFCCQKSAQIHSLRSAWLTSESSDSKKTLPLLDLPEMCLIYCWATVSVCVCLSACERENTCNMLHKCISLPGGLADSARDVSGCVFQSPQSLGGWRLCFVPSMLFGLSVTPVKSNPAPGAGWVHTLANNLSLLCVLMGLCVDMC